VPINHTVSFRRIVMRIGLSVLLFSFLPVAVALSLASNESTPWRWSNVERVVVVPDIHGAFPEFRELLKSSGVIDDSLHWTGGDTHLVSLGDLRFNGF
jgi:hypothetical protein